MGAREQLDELLAGIEPGHVTTISDAATKWQSASDNLRFVAGAIKGRAEGVSQAFGEKSSVSAAAEESFAQSRKHLDDKAVQLADSATKLATVGGVLAQALTDKRKWDAAEAKAKDTPASPTSTATAATPPDHEEAAAAHVTAITTAFQAAIAELQKVDTLPHQPPVDDTPYGGPATTGGGPGSGIPGTPSTPGNPGTDIRDSPPTAAVDHHPTSHTPTGTTTGTDTDTDTGPGTGTTGPGTSSGSSGGDHGGLLQGGGTPSPGTPPSAPTQVPLAPAATAGPAGAGGLGVLGAGAMGGLGGLGSGAGAAPTLRFAPGQAIGQSLGGSGAGRLGGGVLGAEQQAAGRRTGAVAGGGTGSASRGGAGSGRGAAGGGRAGTRAGAAVGGRGRDRDRSDRVADDLWDDGSDWVDDEGSGPAVMR